MMMLNRNNSQAAVYGEARRSVVGMHVARHTRRLRIIETNQGGDRFFECFARLYRAEIADVLTHHDSAFRSQRYGTLQVRANRKHRCGFSLDGNGPWIIPASSPQNHI